ncbi:MAG: hypothetical protein ACW96M_05360 [Candidatus Thorarchaeota archaeon]|jgi:hypothetical protein
MNEDQRSPIVFVPKDWAKEIKEEHPSWGNDSISVKGGVLIEERHVYDISDNSFGDPTFEFNGWALGVDSLVDMNIKDSIETS